MRRLSTPASLVYQSLSAFFFRTESDTKPAGRPLNSSHASNWTDSAMACARKAATLTTAYPRELGWPGSSWPM